MGRRLALEAVHAVADRPAWPRRPHRAPASARARPSVLFRLRGPRRASRRRSRPSRSGSTSRSCRCRAAEEIAALRERAEARAARGGGRRRRPSRSCASCASTGQLGAARARPTSRRARRRRRCRGPVNAVRIGDGAIVTGAGRDVHGDRPGGEGALARRRHALRRLHERLRLATCPTASEYPLGGYEPAYGNKTYGLPAQVAPEADRLLVETGMRLVRSLFPERAPPAPDGWLASGALPAPPAPARPERPPLPVADAPEPCAPAPRASASRRRSACR